MLSVKNTTTSLKRESKLSSEDVCYLYELEGPCEDSELISKFKQFSDIRNSLKQNSPVLIYFHETKEVVDGLVSCVYSIKESSAGIFLVRYTGTLYKDAKWGALNKNVVALDNIANVDPMNNYGILFSTESKREFSVYAL